MINENNAKKDAGVQENILQGIGATIHAVASKLKSTYIGPCSLDFQIFPGCMKGKFFIINN